MQAGNLERAIRAAYEDARDSSAPNPVVLLSPACASFDQFRDFEHRGDVFRELAQRNSEARSGRRRRWSIRHEHVALRHFAARPLVVDSRPRQPVVRRRIAHDRNLSWPLRRALPQPAI